MAYEIITYKKDKAVPANAGLLSKDQKESPSSSKLQKKNLFSKFGKKKKEDGDEYQPPTAPSSPADDTPLDVSVVPDDMNPASPYLLNKANTMSDITMRAAPHRVVFDPSTKAPTHRKMKTASSFPSTQGSAALENETLESATLGSETLGSETPGNNELSLSAPSPSEACSEGSVWNKTMGMLDDLCSVPSIVKKNLDKDLAAAASPPITRVNRPAWGSVPSEDEDDTVMEHSYQSTNANSTMSPDRTTSTGLQTSKGDTTNKGSTLSQIPKKTTEEHAAVSPPTHENFEVVLDPAVLTQSPTTKRRVGWFSKKDNEEEEEEEEEKKSDEIDANKYASSYATNMAALEGAKPEDTAATSSPKKPSLIKRLATVKLGKSKDSQGGKSKGEGIDESSPSLPAVATKSVDQPKRTSNPWNNAISQVQSARENKKAKQKKASEEKKLKGSQDESGRRSQSLGPFIAKLKIPVAALRKISKEGSESKSSPKLPEKPLWKAVEDPGSDKTYYYNRKTRKTTWNKPKPLWKAVEDPSSKKIYYYHRKTRKTTWKKPKELEDWENAQKASTAVHEKEMEVTLQETKNRGLAPESLKQSPDASSSNQAPDASSSGVVAVAGVTLTKTSGVAVVPASPTRPLAVISAAISDESQDQNGDEPFDIGLNKSKTFDDAWEKKREINRLLTGLAPSDKASVNKIMIDSAGNEDELLRQLRDLVESQPFDEPFLDEPDESVDAPPSPRSSYSLNDRVRTHASRASAATKSSAATGKTQKIKNTSSGRFSTIAPISETKSTGTSISSNHDDDNMYPGLPPPGSHLNKRIENARIPSKVPAVPRDRELLIEEFTGSKAETFAVAGRVVRGGINENNVEDSYYGDNEVDTYGTDSVSALSETDPDLLSRKDNFDQARRLALDDAIEREDWELAAVLTEGLRQSGGSRDVADAHNTWNQSALNKFIASNDWSAVSGYIAQMLDGMNEEPTPPSLDELVIPKPSEQPPAAAASIVRAPPAFDIEDPSLKKKIGSKSQLQHRELLSESSWTTDSSYDSYDSDYS